VTPDCFKCKIELTKVAEEKIPSVQRRVRYGEMGDSGYITHHVWRCPSCKKVRAIEAKSASGW
jgi:uncharacterized protein with PIN domain